MLPGCLIFCTKPHAIHFIVTLIHSIFPNKEKKFLVVAQLKSRKGSLTQKGVFPRLNREPKCIIKRALNTNIWAGRGYCRCRKPWSNHNFTIRIVKNSIFCFKYLHDWFSNFWDLCWNVIFSGRTNDVTLHDIKPQPSYSIVLCNLVFSLEHYQYLTLYYAIMECFFVYSFTHTIHELRDIVQMSHSHYAFRA